MMKFTSKFPFIAKNAIRTNLPVSAIKGSQSNVSQTIVKTINLENNILLASIVNLLSNTLDHFDLAPSLPDHPMYSRRDWLGIVVAQLLLTGKCFFHNNGQYYELGTVAPSTTGNWSFTRYGDVINPTYPATNHPSKEFGWITNVNSQGIPYGILGQSGKTSLIAYQQAIVDVAQKLANEPEGAVALSTDFSRLTTVLTDLEVGSVELDPTEGEDVALSLIHI